MSQRAATKPASKPASKPVTKPVVTKPAAKRPVAKKSVPRKRVATPAPAKVEEKADNKAKPAKAKLVRDSFTMPAADFALVAALKARALEFKRPAKKSELLRAGLQALAKLDDAALHRALEALTPLKPGRPKKAD